MLKKFARFNRTLSGWAESIGFAAMVFMVVLTGIDVVGAKLFLLPVPGSLDMMALAQLIAVCSAAAMALIERRHVAVEFFVLLLPKRWRLAVECGVQVLCLALFAVIVWRLFDLALYQQDGSEVTPTTRIPLAPFTYVAALALVPVCLVLLQQILGSLTGKSADEP